MNTFDEDLEDGHNAEREVLNLLKTKYPCAIIISGRCKEMDIYVPEIHKRYEVKKDFKSKYTGNLVVEIAMYDKPSALCPSSKSSSNVFIHQQSNAHQQDLT